MRGLLWLTGHLYAHLLQFQSVGLELLRTLEGLRDSRIAGLPDDIMQVCAKQHNSNCTLRPITTFANPMLPSLLAGRAPLHQAVPGVAVRPKCGHPGPSEQAGQRVVQGIGGAERVAHARVPRARPRVAPAPGQRVAQCDRVRERSRRV